MKSSFLFLLIFTSFHTSFAFKTSDLQSIKGKEEEVTILDLSNQALISIPEEVLMCKNLVELDVSMNGIVELPIGLAKLKNLKILNLSDNVGVSITDLDHLFEAATFQLTELYLNNCELGFLPQNIGRQKNITRLDVQGNKLNNLPYPIVQLAKLEYVNLSNNLITDISWQVNQWWHLRSLDVSENPKLKTDELIFSLSVKDQMDFLALSHLKTLPVEFKHLNIHHLSISRSTLKTFPRVETSTVIEKLSFNYCQFEQPEKTAEIIDKYVHPRYLNLDHSNYSTLKAFSLIDVDSISIKNNALTNLDPLLEKKALKWLDCRANKISIENIKKFSRIKPNVALLYNEPIEEKIGINPPLPSLVPQPTTKTFSSLESNLLSIGSSSITVPKEAFIDKDGKVYQGEVKIEYTEFMEPVSILLSGITMTSDSARENLFFSSGGMINLEAYDEIGNPLKLNEDKTIEVNMMSPSANTAMNLYQLNENGNWEYNKKDVVNEPFKIDLSKIDSAANAAFLNFNRTKIQVVSNRIIPHVKGNSEHRSLELTFSRLITLPKLKSIRTEKRKITVRKPEFASKFLASQKYIIDGNSDSILFYKDWIKRVSKGLKKKYNHYKMRPMSKKYFDGLNVIQNLNIQHSEKHDRLYLNFLYEDSLVNIPVTLATKADDIKRRIKSFKSFSKRYRFYQKKDEALKRKRNRKLKRIIKQQEIEIKKLARKLEEQRQKLIFENKELLNSSVNQTSVQRIFSITGLGIWNCDVRSRMERPTVIANNFIGDDGVEIEGKPTQISVLDFDKNGVITFNNSSAFFDAASKKVAIMVFFKNDMIGIHKSWRANKTNPKKITLETFNSKAITGDQLMAMMYTE